jgi:acetyl esterase/lipase
MAPNPYWRLDPDRIGIGGGSAGAVTALFYGYADRAQGEGKSGNPGFSSKVKLVMPISGELRYDAFCKSIDASGEPVGCHYGSWNYTNNINPKIHPDQPPVLLIHGTADTTVPIREAYAVQARANATGLANKLIAIPGAGHVPLTQLETEPYLDMMTEYMVQSLDLEGAECPKRD